MACALALLDPGMLTAATPTQKPGVDAPSAPAAPPAAGPAARGKSEDADTAPTNSAGELKRRLKLQSRARQTAGVPVPPLPPLGALPKRAASPPPLGPLKSDPPPKAADPFRDLVLRAVGAPGGAPPPPPGSAATGRSQPATPGGADSARARALGGGLSGNSGGSGLSAGDDEDGGYGEGLGGSLGAILFGGLPGQRLPDSDREAPGAKGKTHTRIGLGPKQPAVPPVVVKRPSTPALSARPATPSKPITPAEIEARKKKQEAAGK